MDIKDIQSFEKGENTKSYELFGCRETDTPGLWSFLVWAPNAMKVSLVGDFNGWDENASPMQRVGNAWHILCPAEKGQVYKYAVTGRSGRTVYKADPFASHCETGPATGSKVWPQAAFEWSDAAFRAGERQRDILSSPVSIYEVHLGSWRKRQGETYPWYRSAADELAEYCRDMGYTHVELLPMTEYPYEGSWGYQVTGYFAPTSRYGTPEDFMYFVDRLHKSGIGVIMDWVPAHFPRDEHGLARFDGSSLYERDDEKMAAHPDWGTLIFDYSKPHVQSFLLSSARLFLEEYHIDGLRVDAVSSMLYLSFGRGDDYARNSQGGDIDLGAVSFLQRLNTMVKELGCICIAEESSAYPMVTGSPESGGLGFTFKWDMGFMHDTLDYMELDPFFRSDAHGKLSFSMLYAFSEHFILAFSHDECVHGKKSMLDKMWGEYDDKFASLRCLYAWQYIHPGKKLGFMGGEFGQFIEWDYGRQLDWFLLAYPRHGEMQRFVRQLNHFYLAHPALYARDCSWEGCRWLNVDDSSRSSIAFMRIAVDEKIVFAVNFTPVAWELQVGLPGPGRLELLLSSDEPCYGGRGGSVTARVKARALAFGDFKYSAMLRLPPLSALYYDFREEKQ